MLTDDEKIEEVEASLDKELYKVKWKRCLDFAVKNNWRATANALAEDGPQKDIDYDSLMTPLKEIGGCHAKDEDGQYRFEHKPVPGKYDGEEITTCTWCGKTLK